MDGYDGYGQHEGHGDGYDGYSEVEPGDSMLDSEDDGWDDDDFDD